MRLRSNNTWRAARTLSSRADEGVGHRLEDGEATGGDDREGERLRHRAVLRHERADGERRDHLGGLLDDTDPEEAPPDRLVEEVGLEDPGKDDGDASAHQPRGEQHIGCDGSPDPRAVGHPDRRRRADLTSRRRTRRWATIVQLLVSWATSSVKPGQAGDGSPHLEPAGNDDARPARELGQASSACRQRTKTDDRHRRMWRCTRVAISARLPGARLLEVGAVLVFAGACDDSGQNLGGADDNEKR